MGIAEMLRIERKSSLSNVSIASQNAIMRSQKWRGKDV